MPFGLPGTDTNSLVDTPWLVIYLVILMVIVVALLLVLLLVLAHQMNRMAKKLDRISEDAGKFVQMGMTYFKKR